MTDTPTPKHHIPPRRTAAQPLTDLAIRSAKARDGRVLKLADGGGLSLWVLPAGKYWRWKYRFAGKERLLALGVYPQVTARDARRLRDAAKRQLQDGVDPGTARRAARAQRRLGGDESFAGIAREWLALQQKSFSTATLEKATWMFEQLLFPFVGTRPIKEVTAPELLAVIRRIEARGAHETAHRVKARAGQVFRYAIATGRAERDPAADLRGALAPIVVTHRAALTDPAAIGGLLRAIDSYKGYPVTIAALKFAPLVFVRPGELRAAQWSELDLEAAEWRIGTPTRLSRTRCPVRRSSGPEDPRCRASSGSARPRP